MHYYIGVDAGGTGCRASLYDIHGHTVSNGEAGGANVFTDFDSAMQQISLAIELAINNSKLLIEKSSLIVGAGCAGGQTKQAQQNLMQWHSPYGHLFMTSDLHASCIAANCGQDCVILITGTGSSIARYHNGHVTQYGGHGFIHGDEASGAWLGLSAIQFLLKHDDNLVQDQQFCSAIAQAIGLNYTSNKRDINIDYILSHFKAKLASDYAQLAPVVLRLQRSGNTTASQLVSQGVDYLYSILLSNSLHCCIPLLMTGGLAGSYQPLLQKKLGREVQLVQRPAQDGAMLFAKSNMNSPEVVTTLN